MLVINCCIAVGYQSSPKGALLDRQTNRDTAEITPQAIFVPEFPEGWVVKSSG